VVRQGITPRYVHKLFEVEGISFSQFVLEARLARAYHMLTDSQHAGMTISAVAFLAGFGDLSHFNHSFRRRYGSSPSGIRGTSLLSVIGCSLIGRLLGNFAEGLVSITGLVSIVIGTLLALPIIR
jgi:AraC-like DNA-binding protein